MPYGGYAGVVCYTKKYDEPKLWGDRVLYRIGVTSLEDEEIQAVCGDKEGGGKLSESLLFVDNGEHH